MGAGGSRCLNLKPLLQAKKKKVAENESKEREEVTKKREGEIKTNFFFSSPFR